MEKMKENEKSIFNEIVYNKSVVQKDGQTIEWERIFNYKIKTNTVEELIKESDETVITLGNLVEENSNKFFKEQKGYVSEQQLKFYNDCTNLIFSQLTVKNPILIPVRCGFGKSTFLKTLIGTIIKKTKKGFSINNFADNYLPMIITTDRTNDLKDISEYITWKHGFYNEYTYFDEEVGDLVTKQIPYIYVLEGWNNKINCKNYKKVTSYQESIERCTSEKCKFFNECELGIQKKEQLYSPILAMTNIRLSYLTNVTNADDGINRFATFINKYSQQVPRKRLLIDEKPKLLNNNKVSIDEFGKMKELVNNYDPLDDEENNDRKLSMIKELNHIENRMISIQEEFKNYRNAFIKLEEEVFSENFKRNWTLFFKRKHIKYINALEDMFMNGALWCKSKKMLFYTVSRNRFNVGDFHTFIFDGTAEMSLEYETGENDFVYLNVDDYKKYDYVTFHIIQENFSRESIKRKPNKLTSACDWIKEKLKENTYVISYKECEDIPVSEILTKNLKDTPNIILSDNKIPYFGNTKGKNNWNRCSNMVQIGWNRYNSDIYIAEYLASSSIIKKQIKERYEESKYKIPDILFGINDKGKFKFHELEQYRLMKMIVDFEQEAFRTRIREFSSNEEVHIYLFSVSDAMRTMISQRFSKCKFIEHNDIKQFQELKKLDRKGNEDIARLIKWMDKKWDKKKIESKKVKELLKITTDSWNYVFNKDKNFTKMLKERRVKQKKEGNKHYLIKY